MKYHSCSLSLLCTVVLFVLVCGCDGAWWVSNFVKRPYYALKYKAGFGREVYALTPKDGKVLLDAAFEHYCPKPNHLAKYSIIILHTLLQHAYFIDRLYPATSQESPDGDTIDLVLQFLAPVCPNFPGTFSRDAFMRDARSNQAKFRGAEGLTQEQKENLWPFVSQNPMTVTEGQYWFVRDILNAKEIGMVAEYSTVVRLIGAMFKHYLKLGFEKREYLNSVETQDDKAIEHQNKVRAWILTIVQCKDTKGDFPLFPDLSNRLNEIQQKSQLCYYCLVLAGVALASGFVYLTSAFVWGLPPFRTPEPIPTPSPVPDPTTVHTVTSPTLSFTIITILALIAIAIGIFYYYYRKRKGSKSTSSVSSSSSYYKTRSRRSRDHKKKKEKKKNRKGGKHKKGGSFFSSLSNFSSWAPRRKDKKIDKKKAKKGRKHPKASSIVSSSVAVSNSSAISSSPITRLHDKKKKVRKVGKHPKVSSIYNSFIVSSSPITRRKSPDKKKKKKSPKGGKNRKK